MNKKRVHKPNYSINLIVLLYFNTSTNYLHHYYISVGLYNLGNISEGGRFYPGLMIFPGVITPAQ